MKTFFTMAVLAGGLAASATAANAQTAYQCELQAQQYAESLYPTGRGAVTGGAVGGLGGGLLAGITGNRIGPAVGVGAVGGVVVGSALYQQKKREAHDLALNNCLAGAQPAAVVQPPVVLPPPPFNSTITSSALNVRGGPGTEFPVLWKITSGQVFQVLSCASGWCWMSQFGSNGYVSASFLYPVP